MSLNDRHKRFCNEYIACKFNATQAAINAGYSKKSARSQASLILDRPDVQEYLSTLIEKAGRKVEITAERVLTEIGRLAFADIRRFYDEKGNLKSVADLDDDAAAILSSVEVDELYAAMDGEKFAIGQTKKIKIYDKTKSLEMLGRHLQIFNDKTTLDVGEQLLGLYKTVMIKK